MNKEYIKWLSQPSQMDYVANSASPAEREKRKAELKKRFDAQFSSAGFSAANTNEFHAPPVNFAADISDAGNPSGIYEADDYADYSKKARAEFGIQKIKTLVANSNMQESLKTYILSRNSQIRAANKIAEAKKAKKKSNISKPFWY